MPFDPPEAVNPRCGHAPCANVNECTIPWYDAIAARVAERRSASIVTYAEWTSKRTYRHTLTFSRGPRFHASIYLCSIRVYPQSDR